MADSKGGVLWCRRTTYPYPYFQLATKYLQPYCTEGFYKAERNVEHELPSTDSDQGGALKMRSFTFIHSNQQRRGEIGRFS